MGRTKTGESLIILGLKMGGRSSELPVTRNYLVDAYECTLEIGIKLASVLWRKLAPDEIPQADANLNQIALDLLCEGRFRLARKLLDFATVVLKRWGSDADRRVFVMNRAQAYKWLGDGEECRKVLDAEDWSAVENKFSLGVSVLRDDYPDAVKWMKSIGSEGHMEGAYREWPIFKEFRKTPEFQAAYKDIFGKDFTALADDRNALTFNLEVGKKLKMQGSLSSVANAGAK